MLDHIARLCLSHFLCKFDPKSRRRLTRDIVREVALEAYSPEMVEKFVDARLSDFQSTLVEEFNQRFTQNLPLRFQIADKAAEGKIVVGAGQQRIADAIRFQNSLHRLSAQDFEKIAAIVLRLLRCTEVYSTPLSHDQGVDAFGYRTIVNPTPYGVTHRLLWIAQAKHYLDSKVSTGDVRELVGSKELLVAKVFSTVEERYRELRIRSYAPTAIALVTTEEIPTTVRRLADNAGVFVFASSDLFHLLGPRLNGIYTTSALRTLIKRNSRKIGTLS